MSLIIPTKDLNVLLREFGIATLSDTTPAPPDGNENITWQTDAMGNVSAYISNTPVLNPQGTWSAIVTYHINDLVNYNGSSYISRVNNNLNNQPDITTADWQVLAAGGGDVTPGNANQITFYQDTSSVVNPTLLTTDVTKNNLNIPGTLNVVGVSTVFQDISNSSRVGISDPTLGQPPLVQSLVQSNIYGAGWALGNAGGWSVFLNESAVSTVAQRGIAQNRSGVFNKHAVGDTAGIYSYVNADGGVTASSDEGVTAATFQSLENTSYFHGTISSTTGTGDINPVLAFTSGNNWTTDGAFLLNISKGTISGNLNGASSGLSLTTNSGVVSTFLNKLPVVGTPLTISTAVGIATASISNPSVNAANPALTTITVNLGQIGGIYKPFTAGSVVTVAGDEQVEQSIVQTASAVSGTKQQTITLKIRNPNNQAVLFQGGIQGQYISFDANLVLSGYRSSYIALGSLNGNDLIYAFQIAGGVANNILPQLGGEAAQTSGANSGFHLYPGAEIVANNNTGANPTLEQNGVVWTNGDNVENPHHPTYGGSALFVVRTQYTPSNSSFGSATISALMDGPGTGGGNTAMVSLRNNYNTLANYAGSGGPLVAPACISVIGQYNGLLNFDSAPNTGSIIHIGSNPTGQDPIQVFDINYAAGGSVYFHSGTATWEFAGATLLGSRVTSSTSVDASTSVTSFGNRVVLTSTDSEAICAFTGGAGSGASALSSKVRFEGIGSAVSTLNFDVSDTSGTVFTPLVLTSASAALTGTLVASSTVSASGYKIGSTAGVSGTFTTVDSKTVTVTNGIITSIV